jgi:hypothetical protein
MRLYQLQGPLNESDTSYEKDMDHNSPVVISGVKGVKSTPFRKKFKNMAAYDRWSDSEEASNYEVHQVMSEGYKVLPNIDRDRYGERDGLEGPFRTLSGKVVYYDPREGSYYDPDTDMYMTYDEFRELDNDYSGMKDERDVPVKEALTLDYSRYVRSHGKKPRDTGHGGVWMFTTAEYGEPSDEDMFQFQGSFADAKRAAAGWDRSRGAYRFYVMESDTVSEEKDPCWKNYRQLGTKMKDGREVPNCVPVKKGK